MKKVSIIIQARMASTRLPGKVLMDVCGSPMLIRQVQRLKFCKAARDIIIATTDNAVDDPLVELARGEGVGCFRGSEHDVLSRYVKAATAVKSDVIVRVTADCPLIDPEVVDRVIRELIDNSGTCDYASNVLRRTFPRGMDVEAFFSDTLLRMDRLSRDRSAREHVTIACRSQYPEFFLTRSVEDNEDNSDLRWTVDTSADLELIRQLFQVLDISDKLVSYKHIIRYVREHPQLIAINAGAKTWEPKP